MTAVSERTPAVLPAGDCEHDQVELVGGKAAGLGALIRAGQRVPGCFVVTAGAYLDYIGSEPRRMSDAVRDIVTANYRALCEAAGGVDIPVAVRSSATVEDSTDASCAGQFLTYLGATGADEVTTQIENCWMSAFAPSVDAYRAQRGVDTSPESPVAVVVQELVHAQVAGVMFTRHPRTGDRSLLVIEASYGLGEAVVGGEITPDLFEVNKVTRDIHQRSLGSKSVEHVLSADGRGVITRPVGEQRQAAWALTDEQIGQLVDMAKTLERAIGRGLDIEWAFGTTSSRPDETSLFALQVRPITVAGTAGRTARSGSAIDLIVNQLSQRLPDEESS